LKNITKLINSFFIVHLNINLNPKEKEKQPSTNQMIEYLFETMIILLEINQNNI
jgi:hypothetical protein